MIVSSSNQHTGKPPHPRQGKERNIKVLIVDDEEANLIILRKILENDGFDVISAEDGMQALEKLASHEDISLILLDRMMPHMDGIKVMEEIQGNRLWKDIPVVMQTAAASEKDIIDGVSSGAHYYLPKPFNDKMLLSVVHEAL